MAKAGIVYVGTDDGVVILSDPASIGRWRRIGHELAGESVRAIVAHSALVIDLAVVGLGVQHSDDGGQSWQQRSEEDVVALASHPSTPGSVLLATSAGAIQRSDDNGATWRILAQGDLPAADIAQLLVDPQAPERVLVALRGGNVWASDDGNQWSIFGAGAPVDLDGLVASLGRSGTLFATSGDSLWSVAAPDAQWSEAAGALPAPLSGALAVLAGKTEVLLAAASDPQGAHSLLRSDDDGASWQIASTEAPLEAPVTVIAPAAYHPDTAWAGTSGGHLLLSDDRGRSWRVVAHDLAPVRSLAAVRLA